MAILRTTLNMAAAAGLMATLAGCMSGGPGGGGPPIAAPAPAYEGSWIDQGNTGVSTLSGGVFRTVANDATREVLYEGRYTVSADNVIAITGTSLARQKRGLPAEINFNCLLENSNQLNCTSSTNQQQVLRRYTA